MIIKRKIEKVLKKYIKQYPVVVLTGPRQSGKTTLLKNIFPKYKYVNLENPELREYALSDPKGFLNEYGEKLIIDEVQRAPELFSYIQVIVDEKQKNGLYILSGSQNFLLMEKINQSLAGRVSIFNLLPLSLSEIKKETEKKNLNEILFQGMYPKIYNEKIFKEKDIEQFYWNYIQTYIEKDVRQIRNITDLNQFQRFLVLLAARTGQILNITSLSEDCGISPKTASDWISILKASYIIFTLEPYYKNYNKRIMKSPKIYFYDTGILNTLLNINSSKNLNSHYLKGGIFESFVISEFMKEKLNNGERPKLFYWRDKTGNEVDLLIENNGKIDIVEIKSSETIRTDFLKGLNKFKELAKDDVKKSFVVYGGNEKQTRNGVKILSWKEI